MEALLQEILDELREIKSLMGEVATDIGEVAGNSGSVEVAIEKQTRSINKHLDDVKSQIRRG